MSFPRVLVRNVRNSLTGVWTHSDITVQYLNHSTMVIGGIGWGIFTYDGLISANKHHQYFVAVIHFSESVRILEKVYLHEKGSSLGIVQATEVWLQKSLGFWDTYGSPDPGQKTRSETINILFIKMNFAVRATVEWKY